VAMDKTFYLTKIEELLSDVKTYTVIKKNLIKTLENKLNNTLKK